MTRIGVETSLVAGNFRNVTSSPSQTVIPSSLFSQKIIGTSVTRSTNHLTGTTSLDMNDGGDLLCLNSSFAQCDSSLEPSDGPNSSLQHVSSSDTQFYFDSSTTASEIIFTRCTFLSMKASSQGSAIYHYLAPSSLSISECSFAHIRSTSDYGGAVSFYHSSSTKYPFTLTSSSFVNCSASDFGGSLYVRYSTAASVSESFFKDSTGRSSAADGGAISIQSVTSIVLFNSVFQNCSAGTSSFGGGGFSFRSCSGLTMDSLQFRECKGYYGKDIWSSGGYSSDLTSNVTNCDSTSGSPTWYFSVNKTSDDSLVPQTTTTRTLQSIQTNLEADGVSATLLATVSDAVKGTMLVLVDNTNSHDQATDNSAPAIQRLLSFQFPSLSTTSSLTLTFGDWETLQLGETYSVIGSSIIGTNLSSNYLTLVTPNPSRLMGVVCRNGTGLDHAWLSLVGRNVIAGTFVCEIVGIDDFVLSVSFNGSTEAGSQNMFSTEVGISLFGEGSKFSFNTQYEVNLVTMEGSSEPILLDPSRLFFTTPDPPRLTNVGEVRFTDHSKSSIEVDLIVGGLPASTYTLMVSSASGTEISLPVKRSTSSNAKATAVVYSLTGNEVDLTFGETYTIVSLSNSAATEIFIVSHTITTPVEPPRVEAVSQFSLTNDKTQVEFKMTGIDFFTQNFVVVLTRNGNEIVSSSPIDFVSETEMTIMFPAGLVESSTTLEYGATYTLKSISNATDSFAVNPSLFIVIPTPPIVSSISSSLSANCTHFQLLLTGTNLPSSGTFVASLSNGETFDVTFTGQEGTSKWFEGNATSSLYFNTSYTIDTLTSGEEHIVLERRLFTTSEGPTLKGIEATLGSNPDFVDLTLDVERIGTGEWTLVVVEQGKTTEFLFPVTLLSSSEGHTSVPVYKTEESLEYSKKYRVRRLIFGTLTASIPSLVTFTAPHRPARVESVSHFSLTNDKTQVEFKMTGIDFFTQNFVVVLTRNGNEIVSSSPIDFVSETEMTIMFPAGLVESSTTLEYGATYTLKSVSNATNSIVVNPSLFIVIPTPPIVSSISSSLSANCTHFQLLLTGTNLPSSGTFVASLSNGETFDVTFTGQEGTSKWFEGNATSSLYFNTSYTIDTLTSGEEHIVLERRLFTTSEGPTLKGIETTLGSNPDFVDLTLDVERIGTGEWTLVVVEQGKTTEFLFPVTLLSSSEGHTSVPVYKTEESLEYSKKYRVRRLIFGTLTASIPSLVTFTAPHRPARVESVSHFSLTNDKTQVEFKMTGIDFFTQNFVVVLTRNGNEIVSSLPIDFVSETEMTIMFPAGLVESSTTLEYGATYTLKSISNATNSIVVNPSLFIVIPTPPIVSSISSSLSANCTHFQLLLTGTNLPSSGTFVASLSNGETFDVTFTEQEGTSKWFEGNATSSLYFNTSYTIDTLTSGEEHIVLERRLFTTSEGPTLKGIETTLGSNPDFVDLTLDVERIGTGEWTLVVVEQGKTTEFLFPVTLLSSSEGHTSVPVYKTEESLEYSKKYRVRRLIFGTLTASIPSLVTFTAPHRPARVESVSHFSLTNDKTQVEFKMTGIDFFTQNFVVVLTRNGNEIVSSLPIDFVSETEMTIMFPAGLVESSTTLEYGATYTLKSISNATNSIVVNPSLFIVIPTPPIVSSISSSLSANCTHFQLLLTGTNLPSSGTFVASLSNGETFDVTFTGQEGTSKWFEGNATSSLYFNTSYTIDTLTSGEEHIVLERRLFTTSEGPTLKGIETTLGSNPDFVDLTLDVERIGTGEWTLVVVEQGKTTEFLFPVTLLSSSEGHTSVPVYKTEESLEYSKKYRVRRLIFGTLTASIPSLVTFTAPHRPARVESVSHFSLTNDKTQVEFKMTGIDFFTQNFVVVLTRNGNEIVSSLPIDFVSETEMTIMFPAGLVESSTTLEYGATYTLKSISNATNSIVVNPSLFIVIPTPPIVSSISSSLSANCTHFQLLLTGTNLPSSGTFVASLSNGETFDVTFTGQEGTSKWFEGNATSSLYFNTSYTIDTLTSGEEHIVLERRLFTTSEGPTLKGIETTLGSNPDFVDLTLDVERIGTGEWTLVVVEQGKTTEFLFPVTLLSSSEGHTSVPVYKTEESLEYSKRYEVRRLILGTLTAAIPSLVTLTTPPEPARIESVSAVQNAWRTHVVVTLRGRALPTGSYLMSFSELPSETFTGTLKAVGIVGFEISLNHHTTPHLDYHKTYTLQTLTCIGDAIHLNSGLQFDVLGKGYVVIASESGSDDISTCGTVQKPCSSISFGWERAISDAEVEEAIVRIDKQSRFGDRLEVGKKSLVIGGMWGMKGEIVVEEGISTPKGKEGLLMVSEGEVILSELSLSLPSFAHTLTSTHPLFVIGGWGTCSIEQVTIRGMDGEQIGMGLCGLISGHVSLSDVCMKDCSLSDGVSLICGSAPSNELEMILSDVVVENCTVVNAPLLSFHSMHPSSSFSLVNSQFVSTRLMMSESSQSVKGLVDISTSQTKTEIVGCVFVDCGYVLQNSVLFGNALFIDIGSSSTNLASSRWDVSLASCLFVNNSGVESGDSSGGVWINCGDRLCRISFAESWFEEGLSSTALVRNAQGRVVLLEQSKKKRVVHGGSASRAAVVVERGRLIPQIVRTSSVFSNCRLVVRPSPIS
ncbi:hypothetical protein BLNAU_15588 [Blattamonas nauphoetae]|uniref:Uncharacterized protein n=1 Tax=Blattamonas nauphoetae TaxID=2049346 RepID=A0ABQ9XE57_9EUKA|nr:hypothetical protein BLNAU_15588 [Blattamonas nauphoetae]